MLMKFFALQQAKREKRHFEFKSIKLSHKLPRLEKQITNIQKLYQKKQTQLESQFKIQSEQMKQAILAQNPYSGCGTNGYGLGIASGVTNSIFQSLMMQMYDGASNKGDLSGDDQTALQNAISSGNYSGLQGTARQFYDQLMQGANAQIQYTSNWLQQQANMVQLYMEQQKEIALSQMEEEQEAALLPLNEEQTETELEKTYVETRLTELKEEIETLKSECAEEAKDAAPKFGLA